MSSRTKGRSISGWDAGLAAAIAAVVLLGWLTAAGGTAAAAHPERPAGPAVCPAGEYSPRACAGGAGPPAPARPPALLHR